MEFKKRFTNLFCTLILYKNYLYERIIIFIAFVNKGMYKILPNITPKDMYNNKINTNVSILLNASPNISILLERNIFIFIPILLKKGIAIIICNIISSIKFNIAKNTAISID